MIRQEHQVVLNLIFWSLSPSLAYLRLIDRSLFCIFYFVSFNQNELGVAQLGGHLDLRLQGCPERLRQSNLAVSAVEGGLDAKVSYLRKDSSFCNRIIPLPFK